VLLRHYLERDLSKADVARELEVARRTVYHWIASGRLDRELDELPVRYTARPPVARKFDPFRGIIDARLAEFPHLTATRLPAETRVPGYALNRLLGTGHTRDSVSDWHRCTGGFRGRIDPRSAVTLCLPGRVRVQSNDSCLNGLIVAFALSSATRCHAPGHISKRRLPAGSTPE
jgi:transposase-like protein